MDIQELDLKTSHRAGKHNANADALSRSALPDSCKTDASSQDAVIAALLMEEVEESLPSLQQVDPELDHQLPRVEPCLKTRIWPEDYPSSLSHSAHHYTLREQEEAVHRSPRWTAWCTPHPGAKVRVIARIPAKMRTHFLA